MPGAAIEEEEAEAEAVSGKHGEGEAKRKNGTKTRDLVSSVPKRKCMRSPGPRHLGMMTKGGKRTRKRRM